MDQKMTKSPMEIRLHRKAENPKVTVMLQESAVVVSGEYKAVGERKEFSELLEQGLAWLAGEFNAQEAIIGHIKCSLDIHEIEMYSVTDRDVCRKSGTDGEFTVHLAAIVFAVEEETAVGLVRKMFEKVEKKERTII